MGPVQDCLITDEICLFAKRVRGYNSAKLASKGVQRGYGDAGSRRRGDGINLGNLYLGKVGLPALKILINSSRRGCYAFSKSELGTINSSLESFRILSGGKPTFPTCKFPKLIVVPVLSSWSLSAFGVALAAILTLTAAIAVIKFSL